MNVTVTLVAGKELVMNQEIKDVLGKRSVCEAIDIGLRQTVGQMDPLTLILMTAYWYGVVDGCCAQESAIDDLWILNISTVDSVTEKMIDEAFKMSEATETELLKRISRD